MRRHPGGLGELERYGLWALTGCLVLILGYLFESSTSGDPPIRSARFDSPSSSPPSPAPGVPEVAGGKERTAKALTRTGGPREEFDFFEAPVTLPGREPPPPPPSLDSLRQVVVRRGDTLQKIARRELGTIAAWRDILVVNDGIDPRRLRPGQVLLVPSPDSARSVAAPSAEGDRFYVVQPRDTLEAIALRFLGSRRRWIDLLEANRTVIRDPRKLRVGSRIRIP